MKIRSLSTVALLRALAVAHMLAGCGNPEPGSGAQGGNSNAAAGSSNQAGSSAGGSSSAGSTNGGSAGAPLASADAVLPWQVGNAWTYRVTKNGVSTEKTTTIGALETVGGTGTNAKLEANHVTTSKGAGSTDHAESWQAPDAAEPDRILRFRELNYDAQTGNLQSEVYCDPPKLHIDGTAAHTVKGASWLENYTESTLAVGMPLSSHAVSERWTVIDDNETLKVPAGTFTQVIHTQKVGAGGSKDYWYARGVGKLKETGTQTEELTAYSLK